MFTCDSPRNLVPFVQFKKREKHPWRRDTFSKVSWLHIILLWVFSTMLFVTCKRHCIKKFTSNSLFKFLFAFKLASFFDCSAILLK